MGTLVKFELRKILSNRPGMVACLLVVALLAAVSVLNLTTMSTRDFETGEYVQGMAAHAASKQLEESHAGLLDDEHVAADAAAFDRADQLAKENPGILDMSSAEIIDTYGLEFWQESIGVLNQQYYMEVVGTLDSTDPRATSLQEGARARLEGALSWGFHGIFPYSDAEKAYWTAKADKLSWPMEYGYLGGWVDVLDVELSFGGLVVVALCIALSGVFAGEYRERTAAVILPTKRGKRSLPMAKAVAAFIFTTVFWWLCAAIVLGICIGAVGADGWNLPIQVIWGFDNPYPLSVGQTVLLLFLLGYVVALGMAALTLLLSSKMRSTMPVAVIPMSVVFLGLIALFVDQAAKVAVLTPFSGLNYAFSRLVSYAAGPLAADLPTVLALLYGVMLLALTPLAVRTFKRHQVM